VSLTIHLCFMPKFRLLAAASAPTYMSMAVCYTQGHLIFPPLTLPLRHVRLLFLLLLLYCFKYRSSEVGSDSVVSIATRYGAGGPGI